MRYYAMDLQPLRLDSVSVEPFLEIVWVVLGRWVLVSGTTEAAPVFKSWRFVLIELPLEIVVCCRLEDLQLERKKEIQ